MGKKRLFYYTKYSKAVFQQLIKLGFLEGIKRDVLIILSLIKNRKKEEKAVFIYGVLITDGSLRTRKDILFH